MHVPLFSLSNVFTIKSYSIGLRSLIWFVRPRSFANARSKYFCYVASQIISQPLIRCETVFSALISILMYFLIIFMHMIITYDRNFIKENWEERSSTSVTRNQQHFEYREYMPAVWQVKVCYHTSTSHIYICQCHFFFPGR